LNTWVSYPIYFSSGIRIGYSFKERLDIVTGVGLLLFTKGYYYSDKGYNPNAGSYKLQAISFWKLQNIRLSLYYHFGKIKEVENKN